MKRFTLLLVFITAICSAVKGEESALSTPFVETFNSDSQTLSDWTIIDANSDNYTWSISEGAMQYSYNAVKEANDWLVSPKIDVVDNVILMFDYYVRSAKYTENFSIYAMSTPNDIDGAVEILNTQSVSNTSPETLKLDISQLYGSEVYFAIRCESPAFMWNLYVDNFKIAPDTYEATVNIIGNGEVTINGGESAFPLSKTDVEYIATAAEGSQFVDWRSADGELLSTSTTYIVESITEDTQLTATFQYLTERTVSVAVNIPDDATATIVSPETTNSYITTKLEVTLSTATTSADAYFVNWSDAEGNIISTQQTFIYKSAENINLTANYEYRYTVEFTNGDGGDITLTANGATVQSGEILPLNTNLHINIQPNDSKTVKSLLINGVEFRDDYLASDDYILPITAATSIAVTYEYAEARTISVAVSNVAAGTVSIVSPATEGSEITTKDVVTVTTVCTSSNYFFMGWIDANGNTVSTEESYTYDKAPNIALTANYEGRFVVTYTKNSGGSISVLNSDGVNIADGDRVVENTPLTVKLVIQDGKELGELLINGVDVASQYSSNSGYTFAVTCETSIEAIFADQAISVTFTTTGAGYIEVYDSEDMTNRVASGSAVEYGAPYYIFAFTYNSSTLQSISINGDESDYIEQITEYGSAEFYAEGDDKLIEVVFTGESTGVEDLTASTDKVYGTKGAVVIDGNGIATIYALTGAAVKSIAVKGKTVVDTPQGIYIVAINGTTHKVVVK